MKPATSEDIRLLDQRLKRIEQQVDEVVRVLRQIARRDLKPETPDGPSPPPKRKLINGRWHRWGGEGTGWVLEW
jgi:hypothetical protein